MAKRRCRVPATARPRADSSLRTQLSRSAKTPRSDQCWEKRRRSGGQQVLERVPMLSIEGRAAGTQSVSKTDGYKSGSRWNTAVPTSNMQQPSPSHRDDSRQGRSPEFKYLTARLACPRQRRPEDRGPNSLVCREHDTKAALSRNLDTEPRHPTRLDHHPTIARKASPTRTPPPICASAPFLKPRWSQDRGRCERD